MKKSIILIMVFGLVSACTSPKPETPTVKPTPPPVTTPETPPTPWKNSINPEKDKVFFGTKEDTVIVNTAGDFWEIELFMGNDEYLIPMNKTRDTIESSWSKIIALPHTTTIGENGMVYNYSKKIKLIVFKNETDQERRCSAHLIFANWGAWIDITQSAE